MHLLQLKIRYSRDSTEANMYLPSTSVVMSLNFAEMFLFFYVFCIFFVSLYFPVFTAAATTAATTTTTAAAIVVSNRAFIFT